MKLKIINITQQLKHHYQINMTTQEITKKIVELKLQKPQTQKVKLEIQKLQQKLNK
jgi:hypothetical protein